MTDFLMGNQYIALGAIDAGASSVYAYPGTPSSEILSSFKEYAPERYAQWSINEKVAFELATAEAIAGNYVLCAMKQVGLNFAADPFFSSAYTGVTGALVLVAADDPGPYSSQTEQDSRMYAVSAKVPVFDPSGPVHARGLTTRAFELSSRYGIPVMLRPVMRVCHSRQDGNPHTTGALPVKGSFKKDQGRWAATPRFRAELHGRLIDKLKTIASDNMPAIPVQKGKTIVIASGYPFAIASDLLKDGYDLDLVRVDMPFPLADAFISAIEERYEKIIILEETFPVIENQFRDKSRIMGKWNDVVPCRGEMTKDIIDQVLSRCAGRERRIFKSSALEAPPPAIPRLCPGCGHRAAFYAIRRALPGAIYTGDIGCYTLGTNLKAVDTFLVMSASVTFAEAMKRANPDKKVIATIGDSTFFHSGIPALINASISSSPVAVAILDNATTAMTGFQPVAHEISDISIERLLAGIGIGFIKTIDPYDIEGSVAVVKDAVEWAETNSSPAVIIFRHPCVTRVHLKGAYGISISEGCTDCGVCYRTFECPAIIKGEKGAQLVAGACTGCGVCADICPSGVIIRKAL
jgi:indolepyruvate ferredoxin oxidoreductase, alpha subunit